MHLYVVLDPANSLWWVWLGTEEAAASGQRTRVSPKGWDHQEEAATWASGFTEGVAWAARQARDSLENELQQLGRTLAVTA